MDLNGTPTSKSTAFYLLGHLVLEGAEALDGLHADQGSVRGLFVLVLDDLLQFEDGEVQTGVLDHFQGQDLFVDGGRLLELLVQFLKSLKSLFIMFHSNFFRFLNYILKSKHVILTTHEFRQTDRPSVWPDDIKRIC